MKLYPVSAALCLAVALPMSAIASTTHEVGQKDKKFTVAELEVSAGDSVSFKNMDPFFHNVFSLSDAAFFDLGSYPEGQSKEVKFETAGTVEVECAIHPTMKMTIKVK